MDEIYEIIIYTTSSALSYNVVATTKDFQEVLTQALEEGTTSVRTVEGSNLIINPLCVVAIEVKAAEKNNTPPIS